MAIGDQNDFARRLKAALPSRWFGDVTPVLDAILAGIGTVWASVYQFYVWIVLQTRIATATADMLDLASQDFFGTDLLRRPGEGDNSYRVRISAEMFRERGTRESVIEVVNDLVGIAPLIFEPRRPADTGAYSSGGLGYNVAGGYGSLLLPIQFFVQAFRSSNSKIAYVMGYATLATIGGWAGGGYNVGGIEYGDLENAGGQISDDEMYARIASVLPVNTIAWTALEYIQTPGAAIPIVCTPGVPATTVATLSWTPPIVDGQHGPPTGYHIFWSIHPIVAWTYETDTIDPQYTFTDLHAATEYDFLVIPFNKQGWAPANNSLLGYTTAS